MGICEYVLASFSGRYGYMEGMEEGRRGWVEKIDSSLDSAAVRGRMCNCRKKDLQVAYMMTC
jgi:hypothetical protein